MGDLLDLCRSGRYITDKCYNPNGVDWNPRITNGSGHCYIEQFYEKDFEPRRYTAKNILEIGTYHGGSALLWRDYFPNATIFTADINYCNALTNQERIIQITGDAYSDAMINMFPDNFFDIVIDDGSHILPHMEIFMKNYYRKLNSAGVLVLEDIDNMGWAQELFKLIPTGESNSVLYDMRHVNGRYDDIAIVTNRGL